MTKYGMKFSSVKYWQDEAKALWRYNGIIHRLPLDKDSQTIAHIVIGIAAVCTPERLKARLS